MRLNRYISTYTDISRRKADTLIESGQVIVNRKPAHLGLDVTEKDTVIVEGKKIVPLKRKTITVLLNKPEGFVCSKDGQGSPTVYDLLPASLANLNIAGRLDKDSSGLVVLTNDGQLQQELSHPSYNKDKVYLVTLDKEPTNDELKRIQKGVDIGDTYPSKLKVLKLGDKKYRVSLQEGRNRQIRRTFNSIGINVVDLHRTNLGPYSLGKLSPQQFKEL